MLGAERVVIGGWYETRLRRTPEGWQIAASTLNVTWREGPEELFQRAAAHRDEDD